MLIKLPWPFRVSTEEGRQSPHFALRLSSPFGLNFRLVKKPDMEFVEVASLSLKSISSEFRSVLCYFLCVALVKFSSVSLSFLICRMGLRLSHGFKGHPVGGHFT